MTRWKNIAGAAVLAMPFTPSLAGATIYISSDPTQNMNCQSGVCVPTEKDAVLNAGDLVALLGSGNLTIQNQFHRNSRIRRAGAIIITTPLSWATSSTLDIATTGYDTEIDAPLTIMGTGALTVESGLAIASPITVMGAGALTFRGGFNLSFNAQITFWDLSAQFNVGGTPVTLVDDVPTLAADIAAAGGKGFFALANDYDAKNDVFRKAPIPAFKGTLTGLGHTISNLTIKKGHLDCEGLVSENDGSISNLSLANVRVTSMVRANVGAVAGCNNGYISNISVDGTVTGSDTANVGGIAGVNSDRAGIAIARAAVSVSGGQAGGIVGENDNGVSTAYASGSVSGQSNVGGLVGANRGFLGSCYSTAAVNGNAGTVGGLAGFNGTGISYCYSTGAVSGTDVVGGLVGYDPDELVSDGYWDLDTSGISDPNQGAGFPKDDTSIKGMTTVQLQSRLPVGFDKSVWGQDANINNGFPYLRALPPQ